MKTGGYGEYEGMHSYSRKANKYIETGDSQSVGTTARLPVILTDTQVELYLLAEYDRNPNAFKLHEFFHEEFPMHEEVTMYYIKIFLARHDRKPNKSLALRLAKEKQVEEHERKRKIASEPKKSRMQQLREIIQFDKQKGSGCDINTNPTKELWDIKRKYD